MFFEETGAMRAAGAAALADLETRFGARGLDLDAFGLVVLRETGGPRPEGFAWRGDWRCYPCSLVKVFHLVHALHGLEAGALEPHEDLDRAMRDMILWSSNMATNYVIDLVTGTTGDTRLAPEALAGWIDRREGLNRFFTALGWPEFDGGNISQKLMDDTRYGREAQYAGRNGGYLNVLTPLAAARIFHEIFHGDVPLSPAGRARAMATLLRDRASPEAALPHFQVADYLGGGVPADWPIWSKCGRNSWTGDPEASYYKHDLIRTCPPGGAPLVIAVMTRGKALCEDDPQVFPGIGACLLEHFAR